nr:serine/threonine-protein kinase [Longimicrobium terrae]
MLAGRRLDGRYRVESLVGSGGMGAVFRAWDERLGRTVAVKVLTLQHADPAREAEFRAMFHAEARAAASLRHANVVTAHDFGSDRDLGMDYLVMELLPGQDLGVRLAQAAGPLPTAEVLEILREAGMGIAAGHRAGIIHRDVKPRNIFLVADPDGGWEVKLLDFGIAQAAGAAAAAAATSDATLVHAPGPHTPRYAAPEQIRGGSVTPASDVFALGLTALEMLSGRHPAQVHAATDPAAAARALYELRAVHPHLPRGVDAVLTRAVHPEPGRRFGNAGELVAALHPLLDVVGGTIHLRRSTPAHADPYIAVSAEPAYAPTDPAPAAIHPSTPAPPASPPIAPAPFVAVPFSASSVAASAPVIPPVAPVPVSAPPAVPAPEPAAAPEPARGKGTGWMLWTAVRLAVVMGVLLAWPSVQKRLSMAGTGQAISALLTPETPWTDDAEAEYRRVNTHGYIPGDTLGFVVLASGGTAESMSGRVEQIRAAGVRAGVGTRAVYPQVGGEDVLLLAGPYTVAEWEDREDEVRPFRGRWGEDSRPLRLVLRRGAFADRPRTMPASRVARAEYERLVKLGRSESTVLPVRVAGEFADTSLAAARARLRAVRAEGLRGGLGDRVVYPQLDSGRVFVVIGPYRTDEMRAQERRIRRLERRTGERFRPRTLWMRDPQ